MPPAQALRRLPLRHALDSLKAGEGSTPFRAGVKALEMRYVPKNAEAGPREFVRTIAPRIAYSNPSLLMSIRPYRDPRAAEKTKDPKDPSRVAPDWVLGETAPQPEIRIEFQDGTTQTISLASLSASAIYSRLLAVAGEPQAQASQA